MPNVRCHLFSEGQFRTTHIFYKPSVFDHAFITELNSICPEPMPLYLTDITQPWSWPWNQHDSSYNVLQLNFFKFKCNEIIGQLKEIDDARLWCTRRKFWVLRMVHHLVHYLSKRLICPVPVADEIDRLNAAMVESGLLILKQLSKSQNGWKFIRVLLCIISIDALLQNPTTSK